MGTYLKKIKIQPQTVETNLGHFPWKLRCGIGAAYFFYNTDTLKLF